MKAATDGPLAGHAADANHEVGDGRRHTMKSGRDLA